LYIYKDNVNITICCKTSSFQQEHPDNVEGVPMAGIHRSSTSERELAKLLQELSMARLSQEGTEELYARQLGLNSFGLERLMADPKWDLETAFRVASCLELPAIRMFIDLASQHAGREPQEVSP
jgi:hypothetical protein